MLGQGGGREGTQEPLALVNEKLGKRSPRFQAQFHHLLSLSFLVYKQGKIKLTLLTSHCSCKDDCKAMGMKRPKSWTNQSIL